MPMSKTKELFCTFFKIGAFTFGGGYAMVALLEHEFVEEKRWLTREEFLDMVAIAESTPGPVAVNSATYIGYKLAGAAGAVNSVTFQRATFMTSPLLPVSVAGIMVGLFFITRPYTLVEIVGLIICVFLMIQGMTSIQTAVNRKRWGNTLWWVPLIIGIACVLLGVYALFAPGASTALMMRIAGIMLAFSGVVNMIAAFALTKQ